MYTYKYKIKRVCNIYEYFSRQFNADYKNEKRLLYEKVCILL